MSGGRVKMVCVSRKMLNFVWWFSQSICCVMIMERLEWLSCAAICAQSMAPTMDW